MNSVDDQSNPFPGLRPFRDNEQHVFFGRENQVDAMVDRLAATHFLAVVGTSGSGKSSLVNCGLRPALARGLMAKAGTAWRMAQFRPGNDPIGAMASALARKDLLFAEPEEPGVTLAEMIETNLRMSKRGLIDIFEQAAPGEGVNLLVVVDQFEELFRYRLRGATATPTVDHGMSEQALAFVNLLLEVKEHSSHRIYVVLTMRSDFLGDCTQFPGLAEAINAGQYLVPRLTRDERRAAIERPVAVGGAVMSPVLLTQLVNDVGDDPDQLSMLQHALNRTWARWQRDGGKGPLELQHYEGIGTMLHALDQHAERAWNELDAARQQPICERMFKALTDRTDPRGLRRPTTFGSLCALTDATAEELRAVIDVFRKRSRSFLMPPIDDAGLTADTVIDISHESLMRVWERLKRWTDEEAASARTYRRLAEAAQEHASGAVDVWRDPQLQSTLDWRDRNQPNETWAARYHPEFAAAMAFLDESRAKREADRAEKQRQDQRELEAARERAETARERAEVQTRNAQRMMWALVICGLLAAASIVLFVRAQQASLTAEASKTDAQIAQTRALINAAARSDPGTALLLVLEALPDGKERIDWPVVFSAEDILEKGIKELRERAVLTGDSAEVLSVATTADGGRIVTGSSNKIARVWDGNSGAELLRLENHSGSVPAVATTPDGSRIVTASDNIARIWDGKSGAELFRLERGSGTILAVAVTPDGRRVVTGSEDNTAQIWDGETGNRLFELAGHSGVVSAVAITPGGSHVVTGSEDKTARVWDAHTGLLLFELAGHTAAVSPVAISADGHRVVTGSADKSVRIWENGTILKAFPPKGPHDTVLSVAATPGGARIVTGLDSYAARISADYAARLWTANIGSTRPELQAPNVELKGHAGTVRMVSATANGARLVTASDDGTMRVWETGALHRDDVSFRTRQDLQAAVARAKAMVPRCLTVAERMANLVAPRPPTWCIEMRKYPYNTQLWRDWNADRLATVDSDISRAYGDFADAALKGNALQIAEDAARLGLQFDPSQTWIMINMASAHMFMQRVDEARKEYLLHRGEDILDNARKWNETVLDEFVTFKSKGRTDALMDEIKRELEAHPNRPDK